MRLPQIIVAIEFEWICRFWYSVEGLLLVRLGAKFEDWMIYDPPDILEQIRNSFCKFERGKSNEAMQAKKFRGRRWHQQFLLLAMKAVQVQQNSQQLRLRKKKKKLRVQKRALALVPWNKFCSTWIVLEYNNYILFIHNGGLNSLKISPTNQGSYSPTTYCPIISPINHILPKNEKERNKYKII